MNHVRRVIGVMATIACCSACGLQTDSEAVLFDDIPYGLAQTSTTSTTTSIPDVEEPLNPTTTTTPQDQRTVDVVYVRQFSRELESVKIDLPIPVSSRDLLNQLSTPPTNAQPNLQTEITRSLVLSIEVERGIANVNLSRAEITRLGSAQQRRAIAQLVLTLTLFTSDEGGIGQVVFLVGGEPISVYVPLLDANNDPGQPVAWTDFAQLLVGIDAPATTTTTSVTPTSTTQPGTSTTIPESPQATTTTPATSSTSVSSQPTTTSTTVATS